jgi:acyl-CoA reductase-like NAD-dependent aldehyde dehydrogenase
MQEEIFGPLLPTLRYRDISEVINHVVEGEKPLALYIFSSNKRLVNRYVLCSSVTFSSLPLVDVSLIVSGGTG